jgi:hypothetical protein
MILKCVACKTNISKEVRLLIDESLISLADGCDYIPAGLYLIGDERHQSYLTGNYLLNLKDLVNIRSHPDINRLNGCCGYDGMNGINIVCKKGHEIGTEHSDCWMPHYIHIPPEKVEVVA